MNEFKGFSEAAKLYAEKLSVIEAMQEIYENDVVYYMDQLAEKVEQLLRNETFQNSSTRSYRYWWIGEDGTNEKYTRLWCRAKPPRLIPECTFVMHVQPPTEPKARIERVRQLVGRESFPFVRMSKIGYATISADLTCHEDDLDTPARQIADLLAAVHQIDTETGQCS